jgi:hypothetical protein
VKYANENIHEIYPNVHIFRGNFTNGQVSRKGNHPFLLQDGDVAAIRDTADVAVLLVSDLDEDTCGIGYIDSIAIGKTLSTVKKSCAWSYYSVGHEIGHNIGLDHDPANAETRPYPYATGHLIESSGVKNDDGDGDDEDEEESDEDDSVGYRTIMAYAEDGHETRVNYYSNPRVVLLETRTLTGSEFSNNAKVLIRNRFKLAALGDESSSQCNDHNDDSYVYDSYESSEDTTLSSDY